MSARILTISNLSCSVAERSLLREVSLELRAGEMTALIGPNGAGKTTLLRVLLGLLPPSSGEVTLQGQDIESYSRKALARTVAYVPQVLDPSIPYSVEEFVSMSRYAYCSSSIGGCEEVGEALKQVGLSEMADRELASLSGGERQRVALAAALAQEPQILLLDEPTAHLDPYQSEQVRSTLMRIAREQGLTILCVTHDLNWVTLEFDRVYGMRDGAILFSGTPSERITEADLETLYGVRFSLVPHPLTQAPMVVPTPSSIPQ